MKSQFHELSPNRVDPIQGHRAGFIKQKRPAQPTKGTGRTITMQAEENAHGIGKRDDNLIMVFADEPVVLAVLG